MQVQVQMHLYSIVVVLIEPQVANPGRLASYQPSVIPGDRAGRWRQGGTADALTLARAPLLWPRLQTVRPPLACTLGRHGPITGHVSLAWGALCCPSRPRACVAEGLPGRPREPCTARPAPPRRLSVLRCVDCRHRPCRLRRGDAQAGGQGAAGDALRPAHARRLRAQ